MSQIGLMPDITAIKLRNRGLNFSEKNEEMSQDINFIEGMSSWVKKILLTLFVVDFWI